MNRILIFEEGSYGEKACQICPKSIVVHKLNCSPYCFEIDKIIKRELFAFHNQYRHKKSCVNRRYLVLCMVDWRSDPSSLLSFYFRVPNGNAVHAVQILRRSIAGVITVIYTATSFRLRLLLIFWSDAITSLRRRRIPDILSKWKIRNQSSVRTFWICGCTC